MTKDVALHEYFSRWAETQGMTAYSQTAVPDDVKLPWMTYDYYAGAWGDYSVDLTIYLWFRTESEHMPNMAADSLRHYIENYPHIRCDEGVIWVKTGSPWSHSVYDEVDAAIKGRYINVSLEYWTE